MKVIGISGLPGSGKNLISTKASEKGFIVVNMGDCVREESLKRNEDSRVTAVKLREEYGKYVVANLTIQKIKELTRNIDDFKILSVFSSPQIRFERLKLRKRKDDSLDYKIFEKRDNDELDFGIGTVIATSDFLIINESSIESYENKIDNFLNKIII